jgi:hypothetical protein
MYLHRTAALTPDKSVRWDRSKLDDGALFLAPDAPDDSIALLGTRARDVGPRVSNGEYGVVHRTEDNAFALKECVWHPWIPEEDWIDNCARGSLRLNVSLASGLRRMGEEATLGTGARVTTPNYYGAVLYPRMARILMSFEPGESAQETHRHIVGSVSERRIVYDAALMAVGFDPTGLEGYDDTRGNLLVRSKGAPPEVIKLDAANWETANPA